MSGAALPQSPVLGSQYDPAREAALIKAVAELQKEIGGLSGALENTQPSLITDRFGRVWEVLARPFGYDPRQSHPFEIIDKSEEASELKFSVSKFSCFMKTPKIDDYIAITGLETERTAVDGHWVWLECGVSGNEITTVEVDSGTGWTDKPQIYTPSYGPITKVFIPIAYFKAIDTDESDNEHLPGDTLSHGSNALQIVQLARTHMLACHICIAGKAIPYAIPFFGQNIEGVTF